MDPIGLLKGGDKKRDDILQQSRADQLRAKLQYEFQRSKLNAGVIKSLKSKIEKAKHQLNFLEMRNQVMKTAIPEQTPVNEQTCSLDNVNDLREKYMQFREQQVDCFNNKAPQIEELKAKIQEAQSAQYKMKENLDKINKENEIALSRYKAAVCEAEKNLENKKAEENKLKLLQEKISQEIEFKLNHINDYDTTIRVKNQQLKEELQKLNSVQFTANVEEISTLEDILKVEQNVTKKLKTELADLNTVEREQYNKTQTLEGETNIVKQKLKDIITNINSKYNMNFELNDELQNSTEVLKQQYDRKMNKVLQEKNELQLKTNQVNKEINDIQKEEISMEATVHHLEEAIKQCGLKIQQNGSENTNLSDIEAQIKESESHLARLIQEADEFQDNNPQLDKEIAALKADVEQKASSIQEVSAISLPHIKKYEETLVSLTKKHEALLATIARGKAVKEQLIERLTALQPPKSCFKSPVSRLRKRKVSFNDVVDQRDISVQSSSQASSQVTKEN